MPNVPFVYWSVNIWRTVHPKTTVVPTLPAGDVPAVLVLRHRVPAAVHAFVDASRQARATGGPRSTISYLARTRK